MTDDFTKLRKTIFAELDAYMKDTHFQKLPQRKGNICWDNLQDYMNGDIWLTVIYTGAHLRYSFYILDGDRELYIFQSARSTDSRPQDIAREVALVAEAIDKTTTLAVRRRMKEA